MKKSLLALATTTVLALSSASVFAAAHTGAPMPAAGTTTAPAAMGDLSGTKADAKALNKKGDDAYKAAKKACKPMKGAEEKACKLDARVAHDKSEAKAKGIHEMAEARSDKEKAKVVAKYDKQMADADKRAMKN